MATMETGSMVRHDAELRRAQAASGINILSGIWLVVAPFALGFADSEAAMWNHVLVGLLVAALAATRALAPDRRESFSWTNVALGVWMLAAPWVLQYSDIEVARNNSIIVGLVIIGLAVWSSMETNRAHHEMERGDARMDRDARM
jgi:hypothetical protein